jgi:hypothetical protein
MPDDAANPLSLKGTITPVVDTTSEGTDSGTGLYEAVVVCMVNPSFLVAFGYSCIPHSIKIATGA